MGISVRTRIQPLNGFEWRLHLCEWLGDSPSASNGSISQSKLIWIFSAVKTTVYGIANWMPTNGERSIREDADDCTKTDSQSVFGKMHLPAVNWRFRCLWVCLLFTRDILDILVVVVFLTDCEHNPFQPIFNETATCVAARSFRLSSHDENRITCRSRPTIPAVHRSHQSFGIRRNALATCVGLRLRWNRVRNVLVQNDHYAADAAYTFPENTIPSAVCTHCALSQEKNEHSHFTVKCSAASSLRIRCAPVDRC